MALRADNVTDETANYVPGSEPMIISRNGLSFGLAVGHDILISDLCRFYAENGTDMIICISALTAEQMEPFMKVARARAIEFSIPILVCNMTGNDSGVEMGGLSAFIGIDGEYIESCTSGSDVREIRLDPEEIKARTAARKSIPKFDLSDHKRIEMETVEADPNAPACPLFG
jgi:predicted amidohydrolase